MYLHASTLPFPFPELCSVHRGTLPLTPHLGQSWGTHMDHVVHKIEAELNPDLLKT